MADNDENLCPYGVALASLEADVKHHDKQLDRMETDVRVLHSATENQKTILWTLSNISRNVEESMTKTEKLSEKLDQLRTEDIPKIQVDIAKLNVKSGIWGAIGGLVAMATAALFYFFRHGS